MTVNDIIKKLDTRDGIKTSVFVKIRDENAWPMPDDPDKRVEKAPKVKPGLHKIGDTK